MASWTDAATLKARLGAALSGANNALPDEWDTQIAEALDRSDRWMRQTLTGKCGYTDAQIALANWPTGTGYQLDLATFFFLRAYYANRADVSWDKVKPYDIREELESVAEVNLVDASGVKIVPQEDEEIGGITGGEPAEGYVPADLMDTDEYVEDVGS